MDPFRATDTFVSFLLSLPETDPLTVLATFFLTLSRLVPLVAIAPFLGSKNLTRTVRMMFAVSLCLLFVPYTLTTLHGAIAFDARFVGLLCKELGIGFVLGFLAAVPFYIAQSTGTLIDFSRGSSSLQVTDPTTQAQTSPVGVLYNYLLIGIFFALNGPFFFFDAVASSYRLLPVDQLLGAAFFTPHASLWKHSVTLGQQIMALTIQLAAPALIGTLLTDLFLGIANRLAPQVQVVFLGLPLKSWVGIALMTAAWALILQVLGKESLKWIKMIHQAIQEAHYLS